MINFLLVVCGQRIVLSCYSDDPRFTSLMSGVPFSSPRMGTPDTHTIT
jgi:hypothetical protein